MSRDPLSPTAAELATAPYIVGLTGGIGSGKTTVADRFGELGATLVDADAIAHELTGPGGDAMPALVAHFGPGIAAADGRLDRAAMRERVFGDERARHELEAILHPRIRDLTEARIRAASGPYVVMVVPLLIESGRWKERCDRVLVIDCAESVQVRRVMQRNGLSREQVLAIMAAQASRAQRLAAADDVIDNSADHASLGEPIARLHRDYLAAADNKAARHR
ncbi:MAG: dephospho-CoA kinase [Burkholderiaceae bacterium]